MRAVGGQAVPVAAIELGERSRLARGGAAAKEPVGGSREEQRGHVWASASLSGCGFEELIVVVVIVATATAVVTVTVVAAVVAAVVVVVGLLLVLVARE